MVLIDDPLTLVDAADVLVDGGELPEPVPSGGVSFGVPGTQRPRGSEKRLRDKKNRHKDVEALAVYLWLSNSPH